MMGWLFLIVIGVTIAAALAKAGVPRTLWSMVGAALMLGATGYALQGRPALPASPAKPPSSLASADPGLVELRDRMLGRFSGDGAYLVAADAMERIGDIDAATWVILGGIRAVPESVLLWTGLGNALALHDGGRISPPALFAFQQAMRLSPHHPAPPFFLGLAYVRQGDFAEAQRWWRRALALTPPKASYRTDIIVRLALLDRYLASTAQ